MKCGAAVPWSVPLLWFCRGRRPNSENVMTSVRSHRPSSVKAPRSASRPSANWRNKLACRLTWFWWVSKLPSVSVSTGTPPRPRWEAITCAAARMPLPKTPAGKLVANGWRSARSPSAAWLTSASTRSRCCSAALPGADRLDASRAWSTNACGLLNETARAPSSGPRSLLPIRTPSAVKAPFAAKPAFIPRASQPSPRYSPELDAVSQISIERKCDRFGWG